MARTACAEHVLPRLWAKLKDATLPISLRYISFSLPLSLCVSDNKIKLKYAWQLAERNEWKLLNRCRYDEREKEKERG